MRFTANPKDLLKELNFLLPVMERKDTIPVLKFIRVVSRENTIELAATDLDLSLVTVCPAEVQRPGEMLIDANKLREILSLTTSDALDITQDDQGWTLIKAGKSSYRIAGRQAIDYPSIDQASGDPVRLNGLALRQMIKHVYFAMSKADLTGQSYTSGQLYLQGPLGKLITWDGHRMAYCEQADLIQGAPVDKESRYLVPGKAMNVLSTLLKNAEVSPDAQSVDFYQNDNHLGFKIGDRLLTSRRTSGQFCAYHLIINIVPTVTAKMNRDEFILAVRKALLFSTSDSRGIKLKFTGGVVLQVLGQQSELGEASDSLAVEINANDLTIGVNASLLLDGLNAIESDQIVINLRELTGNLIISPAGDYPHVYKYLVAQIRGK